MAFKQRSGAGSNNHMIKQASSSSEHRVKLPSFSKGRRPEFYENPAIDQLFAIVTALTGELSVLYDRLDTLERVLVASRAVAPNALDTFVVSSHVADVRTRNREELLRRVFAVLEAYADRQTAAPR
jgi:hypothetical protein